MCTCCLVDYETGCIPLKLVNLLTTGKMQIWQLTPSCDSAPTGSCSTNTHGDSYNKLGDFPDEQNLPLKTLRFTLD